MRLFYIPIIDDYIYPVFHHTNHQYIGHPLVGDDLYGGKQDIYNHQLLGCKKVSFIHPITNQKIEVIDQYDTCHIDQLLQFFGLLLDV